MPAGIFWISARIDGDLVAVLRALDLRDVQREEVAGDDLRQESLGRGDRDLRAGVRVEHGIGLARDRRAVGVADRQHPGALLAGVTDRHQGVHRLAGLADRDDERVLVEDRIAVAELRRQLDLARDAGPVLDRVLRHHRGVERGAAGDDDDLVDLTQLVVGQPHLVELQPAVGGVAAEQGVGDGLRLLVDLLEHEPLEATLLGGGDVPVDVILLRLGGSAVEVGDHDVVGRDRDDLVLAELDRLAGVLDERGDVGAEEVLALAAADDQRGVAAGAHDDVGVAGIGDHQREGALEPPAHRAYGLRQVVDDLELVGDQERDDLGVGLRHHLVTLALELGAQRGEVLDDAVVDDGDPAGGVEVRVGVAVVGRAVGGPAGVADAGVGLGQRVRLELGIEVDQLAGLLGRRDLPSCTSATPAES